MDAILNQIFDAVHILDVSVFLLLMILSELSKRIGEALEVPSFYHYFYICSVLLIFLIFIDIFLPLVMPGAVTSEILTVTLAFRAGLVLSTFPVAMIYWRWLFSENMKK